MLLAIKVNEFNQIMAAAILLFAFQKRAEITNAIAEKLKNLQITQMKTEVLKIGSHFLIELPSYPSVGEIQKASVDPSITPHFLDMQISNFPKTDGKMM